MCAVASMLFMISDPQNTHANLDNGSRRACNNQIAGVIFRVETAAHPANFMHFNSGQPQNCLVPTGNRCELRTNARCHLVRHTDVPLTKFAVFSKKPHIIASCSCPTQPIFQVNPIPANYDLRDATNAASV